MLLALHDVIGLFPFESFLTDGLVLPNYLFNPSPRFMIVPRFIFYFLHHFHHSFCDPFYFLELCDLLATFFQEGLHLIFFGLNLCEFILQNVELLQPFLLIPKSVLLNPFAFLFLLGQLLLELQDVGLIRALLLLMFGVAFLYLGRGATDRFGIGVFSGVAGVDFVGANIFFIVLQSHENNGSLIQITTTQSADSEFSFFLCLYQSPPRWTVLLYFAHELIMIINNPFLFDISDIQPYFPAFFWRNTAFFSFITVPIALLHCHQKRSHLIIANIFAHPFHRKIPIELVGIRLQFFEKTQLILKSGDQILELLFAMLLIAGRVLKFEFPSARSTDILAVQC